MIPEFVKLGIDAYVNEETLTLVARRCGFQHAMECKYLHDMDKCVPALVATIVENHSDEFAEKYIRGLFLSRKINWEETIRVDDPRTMVDQFCQAEYNESSVVR
jgi:dsRNA-specific ribonuclease